MNISFTALVFNRHFLARVLVTQWYAESVFTCITVACHFNTRLIPLCTASSSATLEYWVLFIGRSQQATLDDGSVSVKRHSHSQWNRVHLYVLRLRIHVRFSLDKIQLLSLGEGVWYTFQRRITDFVVSVLLDGSGSTFDEACRHSQPSTHWKVSHQLATHGEDTSPCHCHGTVHRISSSSPSKSTTLPPDF